MLSLFILFSFSFLTFLRCCRCCCCAAVCDCLMMPIGSIVCTIMHTVSRAKLSDVISFVCHTKNISAVICDWTIKVSPLKSLLREDLKRRISARANSRVARNCYGSSSMTSPSSNSSGICNSSNTMVVSPEPVIPTSNGAITSTGADNDTLVFGSSSSSKKRNLLCGYCGIEFPDQTLYFLHKGCHSESNPWKCNICSETCSNVYEFNSHLLSKSHQ